VKRLYVLVEGPTEERFVRHVLGPYLLERGVDARPIIVTTRRERSGRKTGRGGGHWKHWRRDLRNLVQEHPGSDASFSTLFDLYGLPPDFPGLPEHGAERDTVKRAELLERAMLDDIGDYRLVPYLQRHEFEALVLVGLARLRAVLDAPADLAGLDALAAEIGDIHPEDVDDGKETAPSKRLERHIPSYQKTVHGPLVVEDLGLTAVRTACPRFDGWLGRLERLAQEATP
jgi:hypothetical protein